MLWPNQWNAKDLKKALKAVPGHMVGDHSDCGPWCAYHKSPGTYLYKNLGYGKRLKSSALRMDLQALFDTYVKTGANWCTMALLKSTSPSIWWYRLKHPSLIISALQSLFITKGGCCSMPKKCWPIIQAFVCKSADLSWSIHIATWQTSALRQKSAQQKSL